MCLVLDGDETEVREATLAENFHTLKLNPADEALIFTPPGFDKPGKPAVANGSETGQLKIKVVDTATGKPTLCRVNVIGADGNDLASVAIPKLVRMLGSTGLDIGRDALSTVVSDYEGPFAFTGTIERASFQIHSRRDRADVLAQANTELARE